MVNIVWVTALWRACNTLIIAIPYFFNCWSTPQYNKYFALIYDCKSCKTTAISFDYRHSMYVSILRDKKCSWGTCGLRPMSKKKGKYIFRKKLHKILLISHLRDKLYSISYTSVCIPHIYGNWKWNWIWTHIKHHHPFFFFFHFIYWIYLSTKKRIYESRKTWNRTIFSINDDDEQEEIKSFNKAWRPTWKVFKAQFSSDEIKKMRLNVLKKHKNMSSLKSVNERVQATSWKVNSRVS